jgi:hypothetical protein
MTTSGASHVIESGVAAGTPSPLGEAPDRTITVTGIAWK